MNHWISELGNLPTSCLRVPCLGLLLPFCSAVPVFLRIMISLPVARLIFIVGSCVLVHSAVSAAQHRSFQRINRQVREAGSVDATVTEPKLPFDIKLETVISAVVVLWSFVQMTVKLKNIRPEAEYEKRTVESLDFRPSFMVFGQKQSLYNLRLLDQKLPVPADSPFLLHDSTENTSTLGEDDMDSVCLKD